MIEGRGWVSDILKECPWKLVTPGFKGGKFRDEQYIRIWTNLSRRWSFFKERRTCFSHLLAVHESHSVLSPVFRRDTLCPAVVAAAVRWSSSSLAAARAAALCLWSCRTVCRTTRRGDAAGRLVLPTPCVPARDRAPTSTQRQCQYQ